MFVALAVATELSGRSDGLTQWGAQLYFWARWAYLPLYLAGVQYLRSLVWLVAAAGLMLMFFGVAFWQSLSVLFRKGAMRRGFQPAACWFNPSAGTISSVSD